MKVSLSVGVGVVSTGIFVFVCSFWGNEGLCFFFVSFVCLDFDLVEQARGSVTNNSRGPTQRNAKS